jgi:hypothetical protein
LGFSISLEDKNLSEVPLKDFLMRLYTLKRNKECASKYAEKLADIISFANKRLVINISTLVNNAYNLKITEQLILYS